jgi:hypothetical protein
MLNNGPIVFLVPATHHWHTALLQLVHNPKVQLLAKHMTNMRETMQMIMKDNNNNGAATNMMAMPADERLKMMEGRMNMMQMMMDQMLNHNAHAEMPVGHEKKAINGRI